MGGCYEILVAVVVRAPPGRPRTHAYSIATAGMGGEYQGMAGWAKVFIIMNRRVRGWRGAGKALVTWERPVSSWQQR